MPIQTGVRFIPRRDKPDPDRVDREAAEAIIAALQDEGEPEAWREVDRVMEALKARKAAA
jgi:hypothetical protein